MKIIPHTGNAFEVIRFITAGVFRRIVQVGQRCGNACDDSDNNCSADGPRFAKDSTAAARDAHIVILQGNAKPGLGLCCSGDVGSRTGVVS